MALRLVIVPFDVCDTIPAESELKIGFPEIIDSLNPYVGLNGASWFFYGLVYDCLTTLDNDMNPTGNLAVSWWKVPLTDPSMVASGEPYGSVWEYNLTQAATWHDGAEFTADDVVYTLNLNAEHYEDLWAYQPYSYFIREAEKVDNYTVRVHFWDRATEDPLPVAFGDFIPIHILPEHLLEQLSGGYAYIGMGWTGLFPESVSPGMPIVGTGPWMATASIMGEWVSGDNITLIRNPGYHWKWVKPGAPDTDIDRLSVVFFDDSTAMWIALKNRMLDVAKFPPDVYDVVKADVDLGKVDGVNCHSGPGCAQGLAYLSCWMRTDGGDNDARLDSDVRKAMAMAVNKTSVVDEVFLGLADPGSTIIPPRNQDWHYEPSESERVSYNVTAANQLLESSGYIDIDSDGIRECSAGSRAVLMGWVDEGTELRFEMPVYGSPYFDASDIAVLLASDWAEIGVNVTWYLVDERVYPSQWPTPEDLTVSHWPLLDPDPEFIMFVQSEAAVGGWSDTGFSNASYNENFTLSVSSLDPATRKGYVDACQRIVHDQCPYLVLAYPHSNFAWRNDSIIGWGDWAADPGRSLDACWGANPLFFDLEPISQPGNSETEPCRLLSALNWIIVAAAIVTAVSLYSVWKWSKRVEPPPKTV